MAGRWMTIVPSGRKIRSVPGAEVASVEIHTVPTKVDCASRNAVEGSGRVPGGLVHPVTKNEMRTLRTSRRSLRSSALPVICLLSLAVTSPAPAGRPSGQTCVL
jgi:hypothetical protein